MISVLVVEDEIPILRSICRQVESANSSFHVTRTAVNGKEAIEALQEEKEYRKGKGLLNFCLNFNKKGTELRTFFRILVK